MVWIVVVASAVSLFAFWLELGLMRHVAPGPLTGSAVSPVPTCQAVFDPATSGPCSRRDSGTSPTPDCANIHPAPGSGAFDECERQNQQAVNAAIQAQMNAAIYAPPCPGYDPHLPGRASCLPATPALSDPQKTGN
jgi:hypothetical protein